MLANEALSILKNNLSLARTLAVKIDDPPLPPHVQQKLTELTQQTTAVLQQLQASAAAQRTTSRQ